MRRGNAKPRTLKASLLAAVCAFGIALADGDSIKDSAKKTERGMGRLLEAMGDELKKAGKPSKGEAKKAPQRSGKRDGEERK